MAKPFCSEHMRFRADCPKCAKLFDAEQKIRFAKKKKDAELKKKTKKTTAKKSAPVNKDLDKTDLGNLEHEDLEPEKKIPPRTGIKEKLEKKQNAEEVRRNEQIKKMAFGQIVQYVSPIQKCAEIASMFEKYGYLHYNSCSTLLGTILMMFRKVA